MIKGTHPLTPKRPLEGTPFQFDFLPVSDLSEDPYFKQYMDEADRKKLIRAALERKIKALRVNDSK